VLREAEAGAKTKNPCRQYEISEPTFYNWKTKYAGMAVSDTRRLKELEAENSKLKKLQAESELDKSALKDLLGRNVWSASLLQAKRHRRRQVALMYPASCRRDVVTPRPR
jgi:putative transposase